MRRLITKHKPQGHWLELENRRDFFRKFAEEMNINPSSTKEWAKVNNKQILAKEV